MTATTVKIPTNLAEIVANAMMKALQPVYEKLGVVPIDLPSRSPAELDMPVEPSDADEQTRKAMAAPVPSAFADSTVRMRAKVDRWLAGQRQAIADEHGADAPRVFAAAHERAHSVARSWEALRRQRETRYTLEDYLRANVGTRL